MGKVIDIESMKPHIVIPVVGTVHAVPRAVFERIAKEETPITDLEDWEEIIPVIVGEWLQEPFFPGKKYGR